MSADNPHSSDPGKDKRVAGKEVEELLQRLPANFRWPKPNAEALAAAVEAIQRMSGKNRILRARLVQARTEHFYEWRDSSLNCDILTDLMAGLPFIDMKGRSSAILLHAWQWLGMPPAPPSQHGDSQCRSVAPS
jgi:hypothetical protein